MGTIYNMGTSDNMGFVYSTGVTTNSVDERFLFANVTTNKATEDLTNDLIKHRVDVDLRTVYSEFKT